MSDGRYFVRMVVRAVVGLLLAAAFLMGGPVLAQLLGATPS